MWWLDRFCDLKGQFEDPPLPGGRRPPFNCSLSHPPIQPFYHLTTDFCGQIFKFHWSSGPFPIFHWFLQLKIYNFCWSDPFKQQLGRSDFYKLRGSRISFENYCRNELKGKGYFTMIRFFPDDLNPNCITNAKCVTNMKLFHKYQPWYKW